MRILFVFSAFILMFPAVAMAGDPVFCGVPEEVGISKEAMMTTDNTSDFCDMYQRQLSYREESLELRRLIEERAENFAAPRRAARAQYEKDMEALNAQRSSDDY